MADENIEKVTVETQVFTNDIDESLKERIKDLSIKRIAEILDKPTLTRGDLVHLAGVSNGSIKSRAESIGSAAGIITAIFDGVRATGTRKPSVESVKSFLDSLTPEEKQKFLAQIQG